jgi:hypothetical protein
MKPIDLIIYIVWYATQQGIRLTTNRLVKFIYLADLYQARLKKGLTLTKFPWKFIYYGPYCKEAMRCIDEAVEKALICKKSYESNFDIDKEYNLFWCNEDTAENLEEHIHIGTLGKLQNAIKKFGDDTSLLLDYVYFETEPMQNARKGDMLDFSKAERPDVGNTIKLKKLSPEAIKKAKEQINKIGAELKDNHKRFVQDENEIEKYKDEAYLNFIKLLDGNELETGLKGTAKIRKPE